MSVTVLRERTPTARKRHWCSLCAGGIEPGQVYTRATHVYDGSLYDWLTCQPCAEDRILSRVDAWCFSDDGVCAEDAHEWATEAVIHGDPDDQRAAKNYLERSQP